MRGSVVSGLKAGEKLKKAVTRVSSTRDLTAEDAVTKHKENSLKKDNGENAVEERPEQSSDEEDAEPKSVVHRTLSPREPVHRESRRARSIQTEEELDAGKDKRRLFPPRFVRNKMV